MSKKDEWTIRCSGHNYITLEWNEKFVFCLDNGWKRDFWGNFPSKDEIEAYIKLKNGKR